MMQSECFEAWKLKWRLKLLPEGAFIISNLWVVPIVSDYGSRKEEKLFNSEAERHRADDRRTVSFTDVTGSVTSRLRKCFQDTGACFLREVQGPHKAATGKDNKFSFVSAEL